MRIFSPDAGLVGIHNGKVHSLKKVLIVVNYLNERGHSQAERRQRSFSFLSRAATGYVSVSESDAHQIKGASYYIPAEKADWRNQEH